MKNGIPPPKKKADGEKKKITKKFDVEQLKS